LALIKCKDCEKEFSTDAKRCPNCGAKKSSKTSAVTWFMAIFFGIPFVVAIARNSSGVKPAVPAKTAEQKRQDDAAQRALLGSHLLKNSMRDPDSYKLERAIVVDQTGAVCYEYRAKNGFGGVNVGNAVLSRDGKKIKTSEMDGFAALWKKECENKTGYDASTAIRWAD